MRGNLRTLEHHRALLAGLKAHRRNRVHSQANDSYVGSGHIYYDVSVPVRRTLAKNWLKENRGIEDAEFLAVVGSLFGGESHEEKTLASILLSHHPSGRKAVGPKQLNAWLDRLVGWAEIDSLCTIFTADEVLAHRREWERFITALARDKNINKRRAALVFLTAPLRRSDDKKLADLGFRTIEMLKAERAIIITKAVSWLLRSMVAHNRRAVAAYIKENHHSLPAIAVRETTRKIATGRK
jgi:3-methyladenine DNA glycosylase AlkD